MKNNELIYPIKFTPILKDKVWGGVKLNKYFNKKSQSENVGESWEISGVENDISEVKNGALKGKTLTALITEYQEEFLGKKVFNEFGNTFPLLFKFIDAKEDLSVQLHPNDELAKKRHNSFGKTEMWYILEADKNAKLILGFNQEMTLNNYKHYLGNNTISEILQSEIVKKGDSYFIETGTVHAIGAGVVLAEIQQTSDITYRIYDYNRPGMDGSLRELHTELALGAINFEKYNSKLNYIDKENNVIPICNSEYFQTNKLMLTKNYQRETTSIDSFIVYMCVEGNGTIEVNQHSERINKGDTILIPALTKELLIKTTSATILEVYIP